MMKNQFVCIKPYVFGIAYYILWLMLSDSFAEHYFVNSQTGSDNNSGSC